MANTIISYDEVRFDVRDEQLTHCYVFVRNISCDGTLGVEGWHHKEFPASTSILDIMREWNDSKLDPLMWPLKQPPVTDEYRRGVEAAIGVCNSKVMDEIMTGKVDHNEMPWCTSCAIGIRKLLSK